MHESMELVFLGTGGSWPSVDRNVASIALKRGSEILLFDCGEGTQRQFQRSKLSYMQVSKIFITHLHADHFLGIPGLVQTMRLNERRAPLDIYGPPGTEKLIGMLTSIGRGRGGYAVRIHEIEDGDVVEMDGCRVVARAIKHTVPNLGYALVEEPRPGRFNKERALELGVPEGKAFGQLQRGEEVTTPDGRTVTPDQVLGPPRRGRKVVYTGDCVPDGATVELAKDADVLIHDSTYMSDFDEANANGHSTSQQAAFIAEKANVKDLFLTHISPRYRDVQPLVKEARAIFRNAHEARDFLEHVVKFPKDEVAKADKSAASGPSADAEAVPSEAR